MVKRHIHIISQEGYDMKKKLLMMLAMVTVLGNACYASVISPKGAGQIGYSATVLCNSLSLHQKVFRRRPR